MTKEQFLAGVQFRVKGPTYRGAETFRYDPECKCITKQSLAFEDERTLYDSHHCNIVKIGRLGFTGFTFVMNKKVVVKYKFEDLIEFIPEQPLNADWISKVSL